MANTTYPTFVDQLLGKIRALPQCAPPVFVYDGIQGPNSPDLYVAVGGMSEPTEEGTVEWAELGADAQWEDYEVQSYIYSWVGGDDNFGQGSNGNDAVNDAQKTARDNAFTVYNAINAALLADVNFYLSNLAAGGTMPLVQWCNISKKTLLQTPAAADGDTGQRGRAARIDFSIYVRARIPKN
jgi:hypothetical protein